jgi:hypothetical protein
MGSKFYVSLEAARLLKGKGYNEAVGLYYNTLGELINVSDMFYREVADNIQMAKYDYLFAPSKAEAIDWLESKGIGISIIFCEIEMYEYVVESKDCYYSVVESGYKETRLEAEEAAIIKALELL